MNLPSTWKTEIPVLACRSRTELLEAEAFERALLSALEVARGGKV
jgi:hypothetical protein